jgi:dynein light intermediate chain 2
MLTNFQPHEILDTLTHFLSTLRTRIEALFKSLESRGSKRPAAFRAQSWAKYGDIHPDKANLTPFLVPIVIIGSKYDLFRALEPEKQKLACKTLRYLAHINGASLLFVSSTESTSCSRYRQLISHLTFKSPCPKIYTVDYQKPIFVVAGQDTLAGIGNPPSVGSVTAVGKSVFTGDEVWRRDYAKYFVGEKKGGETAVFDVGKYPCAPIDNIRAQKDEELEKLRRNNALRVKEVALSQKQRAGSLTSYSRSKAAATN